MSAISTDRIEANPADPPDLAGADGLDLWARAVRGDLPARKLLLESSSLVARRALARRAVPSEELGDLVQEVLVAILEPLDQGRSVNTNVAGFVHWRAIGVWTRWRRQRRSEPLDTESVELDASSAVEASERRRVVELCVAKLSASLRAVVEARYFRGWSTERIAEELGIAPATVHVRHFRALEPLRQCCRANGLEEELDG